MDQDSRVVPQRVAVVGVEAGGQSAASLVSEEVTERVEGAVILSLSLQLRQLLLHAAHDELLRLDLRHLHIAMGITVQRQLITQRLREVLEQLARGGLQMRGDVALLRVSGGDGVVDLSDQRAHLGNELDESLRQQNHAVVLPHARPLHHQLHHLLRDLLHRLACGGDLLADEGVVGVRLERTLHRDV